MVKMDNVVRCYRGIDPNDGSDSLFVVKNNRVAPAWFMFSKHLRSVEGFESFDSLASTPTPGDASILAALDQFELLWEKQE